MATPSTHGREADGALAARPGDPRPLDRRVLVAWCLYDFANSWYVAVIPATIWSAYYATYVVGNESGLGDVG